MRLPVARGRLAPFLVLTVLVPTALAAGATTARAQSLRGSPESVERMYQGARRESLAFHETPSEVTGAARGGALVRLTPSRDVTLRRVGFPYVTAATQAFVERLGARYRKACGQPLMVTSAARPTTRQPRNSVALSVHPTGMAVDLRKPTGRCLTWLRATLLDLEGAGVIEATEERRPPHFHVAVYPTSYTRYAALHATDDDATRVAVAAPADADPPRAPVRAVGARVGPRARLAFRVATRRYQVRAGDTLWEIARANRLSVDQLIAANRMKQPVIRPGQRLVLPRAGDVAPADHDGVGR